MPKKDWHSTVSRRDFMKAIGFGAAGLGAAAATPVFHDMDEVLSTGQDLTSTGKRPWWVKEVDKPTVEIDLNLRTPFGTNGEKSIPSGMLSGSAEYNSSPELVASWNQMWKDNLANNIVNGKHGNEPRDIILYRAGMASRNRRVGALPVEGWRDIPTIEDLGGTKWHGTPEENALMMRAVSQFAGFSWVGYVDLNDNSIGPRRRLFNYPATFRDVEDSETDGSLKVYPSSASTVISIIKQNGGKRKEYASTGKVRGCTWNWNPTDYSLIQNFLWGIGYKSYFIPAVSPPWHILAGIGEYTRTHGPGVTPEGYFQKTSYEIATDLPCAPSKPIDMGVLKWCGICGRCAEACPANAIPTKEEMTEPTWERATGKWSASNDHCGYPNHSDRCWTFWAENIQGGFYPLPATQCSICTHVCPFNKEHTSWIHEIVKGAVSTTSLLNSFFLAMDGFAGYGEPPTDEQVDAFWKEPMPAFGNEMVVRDY